MVTCPSPSLDLDSCDKPSGSTTFPLWRWMCWSITRSLPEKGRLQAPCLQIFDLHAHLDGSPAGKREHRRDEKPIFCMRQRRRGLLGGQPCNGLDLARIDPTTVPDDFHTIIKNDLWSQRVGTSVARNPIGTPHRLPARYAVPTAADASRRSRRSHRAHRVRYLHNDWQSQRGNDGRA